MRFAEIQPDAVITAGPRLVTAEEIVAFASRYDPQPFHVDPGAAARSQWGELIASGWHTCSIAMALAVEAILLDSESIASPGVEQIRWEAPVRAGDALRLAIFILSKRVSSSGKYGIVQWRWELSNQHEVRVMSLVASCLFAISDTPDVSPASDSNARSGRGS
jgi:acyl dehydratase